MDWDDAAPASGKAGILDGVAWLCAAPPTADPAAAETIGGPAGVDKAFTLAIAMAEVSGRVRVTVCGALSPGAAQTVQVFLKVVIGMLGVSMLVAPCSVQSQWVVVSVVVMVV